MPRMQLLQFEICSVLSHDICCQNKKSHEDPDSNNIPRKKSPNYMDLDPAESPIYTSSSSLRIYFVTCFNRLQIQLKN